MIKRLATAVAALTILAAPSAHADEPAELTKVEAELAKIIGDRVAGEPESCIQTVGSLSLMQIDDTALVYRRGDTIWVNYTRTPEAIDDSDYLVIERFNSMSLCRTDRVRTATRSGNFMSGIIFLDDFVPYRKTEEG